MLLRILVGYSNKNVTESIQALLFTCYRQIIRFIGLFAFFLLFIIIAHNRILALLCVFQDIDGVRHTPFPRQNAH